MSAKNIQNLHLKEECYAIIGACMTMHNQLGAGFLEQVYQEALAIEFEIASIPFERERRIEIYYRDKLLEKRYIADFVCYEQVIVEIKAVDNLAGDHTAQILNYLKATNLNVGLLINFGKPKLEYKRLVL